MTKPTLSDAAQIVRGQRIIIAAISVSLLITAADMAIAIIAGTWKPEISAIRLVLIGILLWAMYRGRTWARLLFLILVMVGMAFAGAILIEPPKENADAARVFSAVVLASGAALVWFLSFDKSLVHYERVMLRRYPKLFSAASHADQPKP
jgi:hypothetical protein